MISHKMNLELLKSDYDEKEYRLITLGNGLQALLVSDVKNQISEEHAMSVSEDGSEMDDDNSISGEDDDEDNDVDELDEKKSKLAACSLCVAAGSYYDPPDAQGLAHFLEHMLFMGSEKYPEENAWDDYVQLVGGSSNAATAYEFTRFHFECREQYLNQCMNRFSHFFISPLLKKSSMAREREAVDSEFESSVTEDDTKFEQLLGSFAPDGHPARTFSWGNKESLQKISDDEMLKALRDFWQRYYTADRMKLTVVSRLPLDVLEKYVLENFSAIPNSTLPVANLSSYRAVQWGPKFNSFVFVKPSFSFLDVSLTWVLPPLHDVYEADPLLYINFFIAHEGKGSILHYLKEKVWALRHVSGRAENEIEMNTLYDMFSMTIKLTPEGFQNLHKVVEAVFVYLAFLRKNLPDKRIFDEYQAICLAAFRNKSDVESVDLAQELSFAMHFYKPKHYLSAGEFLHEYRPDLITSILNQFGVDNVNIIVRNSSLDASIYDQEEYWCKTMYKVSEIEEEKKKAWTNAEPLPFCSLPSPNPYLTKNFDILSNENNTRYPEKIMETPLLKLWYRQDTKFKRPIAFISIYMTSTLLLSIKSQVVMYLFVKFIKMKLKGNHYDAALASYNWKLKSDDYGMHLTFSGFNEKLPLLFSKVWSDIKAEANDIANPSNEALFIAMKGDTERKYTNYLKDNESFARSLRLACMEESSWTYFELDATAAGVTLADMAVVCKEFFANFHAWILVQGNISAETAKQIGEEFSAGFDSPLDSVPKNRVWKLPPGEEKYLRVTAVIPESKLGTVVSYYQYGPLELRTCCLLDLLKYHMSEPLFDNLRTKQQLGYEVYCMVTNTSDILGYLVYVCHQGKFTADDVNQRVDEFFKEFAVTLRNISDAKFEKSIETLCALKSVEDNSLQDEFYRNYSEIVSKHYLFDRREMEVATLKTITQNELCDLFEQMVVNRDTRKKFGVQILPFDSSIVDSSSVKTLNGCEEKHDLNIVCPDPNLFIRSFEELRPTREFYPVKD